MIGLIKNARLPQCIHDDPNHGTDAFALVDIALGDTGIVTAIEPAPCLALRSLAQQSGNITETIDLDHGIIFPGFVECHTHLDKGHIWPRRANPDGSFMGALENVGADREANWSAHDVQTRMEFSLRSAYAHGVTAIRTHLDSIGKQISITWPIFAAMRERWKDQITLQATPLFAIESALDPDHMKAIVTAVKTYGSGIIGAVTYMSPGLDQGLKILFKTAMHHHWDLDFHVDEANDPAARSLERIALTALKFGFKGKILCGHCCSLALQGSADEKRIIALVRQAGISIVSLPMCNMYLQDRQAGRTPRWRGVTSLHELRAAGVPVMIASDNTRDPFYAYGDLDTLEVFREATRIAHFDHPFGNWLWTITKTPADILGLPKHGRIRVGYPADLILFKARNWTELLSRPQADRIVIREGKQIDTTLPDYRELDGLEGMRP